MTDESVLDDPATRENKLFEAAAKVFDVSEDTLTRETRFDALGADEHSAEELKAAFEDLLTALRGTQETVYCHVDFDGAQTLGELAKRVQTGRIG